MLSVYQHWDPLRVCVVGRSYPPDFYSWIKIPHVRKLFEKIAIETEEDYQAIIQKLKEFDVEILRPSIPKITKYINGDFIAPPMTPRDHTVMIGQTYYENYSFNYEKAYARIKDPSWPPCQSFEEFTTLPNWIRQECDNKHLFSKNRELLSAYDNINEYVRNKGNTIKHHRPSWLCGAHVSRIGRDLFFGTESYDQDVTDHMRFVNAEFTDTRNHVVNTGGHSDGTYCPVCPGLIISLFDVPNYTKTFPDWEVVYLPKQSWSAVQPFLHLKKHNQGKWWIPGFEYDTDVVNVVETWLGRWTGYVEETVFDVNMLIIDPKNVMVFNYNKKVFDAFQRYSITPHVVPFRHRYFWDGGIHCVTSDLYRQGHMQDFFPQRG